MNVEAMLNNFGQLYTFEVVTSATNDSFYLTSSETVVNATYLAVIVPLQFSDSESEQDVGIEQFGTVTIYMKLDSTIKKGDRVIYNSQTYVVKEEFFWEFTFKAFTAGLK